MLLDPGARQANSAWSFVGSDVEQRFARTVRADLASGAWDRKVCHLRHQPFLNGSLRLVTGHPTSSQDASLTGGGLAR